MIDTSTKARLSGGPGRESFSDSGQKCMVCQWTYPQEYDENQRNTHANLCIDGHG